MLFNSFEYLIFLPTVFLLYWFVFNKHLKLQNLFLLVISYVFYGWWDWRFLALIAFSSFVDYNIGLRLDRTQEQRKRKLLLYISMLVNLGFLGYFKYYNFFIDNFKLAFESIGINMHLSSLQIILPVGISFYTFQTMSYTIDVYRKKLEPTKNVIEFFAYVSFFPQLVAGPIERAKNLLPQFKVKRKFSYDLASDGMRQILWGLFKKMVIADNCAVYVNQIFDAPQDYNSPTLILGAVLFAFQIYGDFSGYSDIAIGTAKLFGFNLMQNFATPYFSRDIAEFWRRWHISLSTWFRDYVYIPLGGSKGGKWMKVRNTFIIFLVSGFWHGANWTFIVWGFLNALFFLPLLLTNNNRNHIDVVASNKMLPSIKEIFQIGVTFVLTCFAWIFFRAKNMSSALNYLQEIGTFQSSEAILPVKVLLVIALMVLLEWGHRERSFALQYSPSDSVIKMRMIYAIVAFLILTFGNFELTEFIYFDF
ncbi:D-alanyl-lipoteichoic acid acyltransferase DltB (MBOAT superfamily) [Winogradskyella eximia]|uniref:D-alanyl-lipoteichoic acid acyltransferase DltB (MBOAT superfamily) n=2 Tax=Winogradskyella eximia TaxID=262006 RepID=A0A3D9HC66_9FLAO|nr:MBOAT family O-acyltransferase [Winogradskyella eximia]RED47062.1 D-alanyl-lipoteichoic acid acyltransferase DltB (MBOAT superfamily) [Winogradskyella eximia]